MHPAFEHFRNYSSADRAELKLTFQIQRFPETVRESNGVGPEEPSVKHTRHTNTHTHYAVRFVNDAFLSHLQSATNTAKHAAMLYGIQALQ